MKSSSEIGSPELVNQGEEKNFFLGAVAWHGSVTPRILPRVLIVVVYSLALGHFVAHQTAFLVPFTPFEYSGAVLGLILVLRVNAGLDRWWEARKIWGSIVNQSRNLATIVSCYGKISSTASEQLRRWVAAWPHVMRESLRREHSLEEVTQLLGEKEAALIRGAAHMPSYVGCRIAELLESLRQSGLDDFSFLRAEGERSQLIDAIGACERIRNTPIPLVLAIQIRRFLLLFLLLLPLAMTDHDLWVTPIVMALTSYPLFCLDEIGAELQNPFSPRNYSHLPLKSICANIENNVMAMGKAG